MELDEEPQSPSKRKSKKTIKPKKQEEEENQPSKEEEEKQKDKKEEDQNAVEQPSPQRKKTRKKSKPIPVDETQINENKKEEETVESTKNEDLTVTKKPELTRKSSKSENPSPTSRQSENVPKRRSRLLDDLPKTFTGKLMWVLENNDSFACNVTISNEHLSIVPLTGKKKSKTIEWRNIIAVRKNVPKIFSLITIEVPKNKFKKAKRVDISFLSSSEEETDNWVSSLHPFVHSNPNAPKKLLLL